MSICIRLRWFMNLVWIPILKKIQHFLDSNKLHLILDVGHLSVCKKNRSFRRHIKFFPHSSPSNRIPRDLSNVTRYFSCRTSTSSGWLILYRETERQKHRPFLRSWRVSERKRKDMRKRDSIRDEDAYLSPPLSIHFRYNLSDGVPRRPHKKGSKQTYLRQPQFYDLVER